MVNIITALGMATQSMQLLQQLQQLMTTAIAEKRDLTDDELNLLVANYMTTHAAVDKFLADSGVVSSTNTSSVG